MRTRWVSVVGDTQPELKGSDKAARFGKPSRRQYLRKHQKSGIYHSRLPGKPVRLQPFPELGKVYLSCLVSRVSCLVSRVSCIVHLFLVVSGHHMCLQPCPSQAWTVAMPLRGLLKRRFLLCNHARIP
jgi:hypothetical protein